MMLLVVAALRFGLVGNEHVLTDVSPPVVPPVVERRIDGVPVVSFAPPLLATPSEALSAPGATHQARSKAHRPRAKKRMCK